jgi:hypothetical protein
MNPTHVEALGCWAWLKSILQSITILLAGLLLLARVTSGQSAEVKLTFYDRDGKNLSVASALRLITSNPPNASDQDSESPVLLDPTNLRLIKKNPLEITNNIVGFKFDPSQPTALAVNWPTDQGYSLLILDNSGKGFSESATVNFTFQASIDSFARLDAALASRSPFQPSKEFSSTYERAKKHLETGKIANSETIKGKEGARALDDIALATDLLLAEYGVQYARSHFSPERPWIGVTLDDIDEYERSFEVAKSITLPNSWIRIVFDPDTDAKTYDEPIKMAKSQGLKLLGLPIDSHAAVKYISVEDYVRRVDEIISRFPQIDAWEVGNEVNGSWLVTKRSDVPPNKEFGSIALKVERSAALVKRKYPEKRVVLTLYWQLGTDLPEYSTFDWAHEKLNYAARENIDVVLLSTWIEDAPLGLGFDQVMRALGLEFPDKEIGLGELGYWNQDTSKAWWAYDKNKNLARKKIIQQYYRASLGYPNSIGGGFWWYFKQEMAGRDSSLRSVLLDFTKTLR